jgi:hypothetical protein
MKIVFPKCRPEEERNLIVNTSILFLIKIIFVKNWQERRKKYIGHGVNLSNGNERKKLIIVAWLKQLEDKLCP